MPATSEPEAIAIYVPPALAALFAFALGAKARDWPDIVDWFQQLNVPRPWHAALLGLASEAGLVVSLVVLPTIGLVFALVWLAAATLLLVHARRLKALCACFGRSAGRLWSPLIRNLGLMGIALFAIAHFRPRTARVSSAAGWSSCL